MPYQSGEVPVVGDHARHITGKPGKVTAVALNQGNLRNEDQVRVQWDDGSTGVGLAPASEFIFVSKPSPSEIADFLSHCPVCKEPKHVSHDRDFLKVALENNEEIRACSICGHSWIVQDHEKDNLRKALKEGIV